MAVGRGSDVDHVDVVVVVAAAGVLVVVLAASEWIGFYTDLSAQLHRLIFGY